MVIGTQKSMTVILPALLGITAGYVDTASFVALHGLFTAHVTGNFVTIGAALVFGTTGVATKLLALPVFCAAVFLLRLLHYRLADSGRPLLKTFLGLQAFLLCLGAVLAIGNGSFPDGDAPAAMATGLVLVVGMAIQNGMHRVHLKDAPPTTMMTGTTTQIMLDFGDLVQGTSGEQKAAIYPRLARMGQAVLAFVVGCALAALLYATVGIWCFALPPLLVIAAYLQVS